jgi:periplasmic divalent cation tolerance protein
VSPRRGPLGPAFVRCPFTDSESTLTGANWLLDERPIACANMIPGMVSLLAWYGERGKAEETGALFKTDAALLDRLVARLAELRLHDEPAILGWRCDAVASATRAFPGVLTQ